MPISAAISSGDEVCTILDYCDHGAGSCVRCGLKAHHHPLPELLGERCERVLRSPLVSTTPPRFCGSQARICLVADNITRTYCLDCFYALARKQMSCAPSPHVLATVIGYDSRGRRYIVR